MDYLKWNDIIAKHFFNEGMARKEVLIYVNESLINSLGKPFGVGEKDFIEAVKQGPNWVTSTEFCKKAHQTYEGWRGRAFEYPPYIAYLACCVLAATLEGDWAPQAYYPRLRKLLKEPENFGQEPSITLMEQLWKDLEKWSREDKKEELGRFVVRLRGGWRNVGLPWSQTIISDDERKNLNKIFRDANLDPTDMPSPEVIPRILLKFGQDIFEKRTRQLLDGTQENQIILRNALVAVVLEELEQWDGNIIDLQPPAPAKVQLGKQVVLRICLKIDEINKTVDCYFRIKTNSRFPEDWLNFELPGDTHTWSCKEDHEGWSNRLRDVSSQPLIIFDASMVDWLNGTVLYDNENHWEARLGGQTTRLFLPGEHDGLYDWVESHRLERGMKFYVASFGQDAQKVKEWGEKSCDKFKQVKASGLPYGWELFYGENASSPCSEIDVLALSSQLRLKLKGIRIDNGNTFLRIAPPEIIVENGSGDEKVIMNGQELNQHPHDKHIWIIPKNAPPNQILKIEIEGSDAESKLIILEDPDMSQAFEAPFRNERGDLCSDETASPQICGVVMQSEQQNDYTADFMSPTHLSDRIIFIGPRPGEIYNWPKETTPPAWHPVWAIAKKSKKKWKAIYCGGPESLNKFFKPGTPLDNPKALKKYKEIMHIRRKLIKKPSLKMLRSMWENYARVTKNA